MDKQSSQNVQKTMVKNRLLIREYLSLKYTDKAEMAKLRSLRLGKLMLWMTGISMVCHGGLWIWYYLEFDINLFKPKASEYLKNRLK